MMPDHARPGQNGEASFSLDVPRHEYYRNAVGQRRQYEIYPDGWG